jgi:tetratricopeptide (TPR) repeat protein
VTEPGGTRHYGLQEIKPVAQLAQLTFEFDAGNRHGDFGDHDRRMEELARQAAAHASDTTLVLESPIGVIDAPSLIIESDGDDLIEDARANIDVGEFAIALELLEEFLEISPDHAEARYLQAYCLYRTGGPGQLEALRILRPLRDEPLETALQAKVRELRRELRRLLTPAETVAFADTVQANPEAATERIRGFIELAPEEGIPPYMLAVTQARAGDIESAYQTAASGAATAESDRSQVASLARRLEVALVAGPASASVAVFKSGDYAQARRELERIDARWRDATVIRDFGTYLGLLQGWRGREPLPDPSVPADRAEGLYSLIAGPEAENGVRLINAGYAREAEPLLAAELPHVPGWPWLNFLYAVTVFVQGHDPDRAVAAAEIARRDPSISQAGELLAAIHAQQDAVMINPALDEFAAAMESVRDGATVERLQALGGRLRRLRRELPGLEAATLTQGGLKTVRDLTTSIEARLTEVANVMIVARLYEQYDRTMRGISGGLSEPEQVDRLDAELSDLARQIEEATQKVRQGPGAEQLAELAGYVASRRRELAEVSASIQVSRLVGRFNQIARSQPVRYGQPNAYRVHMQLTAIHEEAKRLRRAVKAPRDREVLDQLIQTTSRMLIRR